MKLHASQNFRGKIIDLDTGREVKKVIWLDYDPVTGIGILEAYRVRNNKPVIKLDGSYETYRAKGRFRFIPRQLNPPTTSKIKLGAKKCAKCTSSLTLPGDDLCPTCRAKDRGLKNRMKVEKIFSPILNIKCNFKGCTRCAEWSVSDEVIVSPSVVGRGRSVVYFERGATVGRRYYCSFHFVPPRILDANGEIVEELEESYGVRPH